MPSGDDRRLVDPERAGGLARGAGRIDPDVTQYVRVKPSQGSTAAPALIPFAQYQQHGLRMQHGNGETLWMRLDMMHLAY